MYGYDMHHLHVQVFTVCIFINVFIAETLILKCQPTSSIDRTM